MGVYGSKGARAGRSQRYQHVIAPGGEAGEYEVQDVRCVKEERRERQGARERQADPETPEWDWDGMQRTDAGPCAPVRSRLTHIGPEHASD